VKRAAEWARFWLRDGVEHLHAHYLTHAFAPHTHEGYVFATFEAGAEAFRYRGATHRAGPGFVTLLNPGEVHTGHAVAEGGWCYRTLYPRVGVLRCAVERVFGAERTFYFPQAVVYSPDLAARVRRYHLLSERGPALARGEAFLGLVAHLAHYADVPPSPRKVGQEPRVVRQVRAFLEAHLETEVTLADLGALTSLSPYALLRTFRRQTGLTPREYQLVRRVEAAKGRLARGEAVAAVAVETGFYDQSHLGRHFKRIVGVTPKVFARGAIAS